MAVFSTNQNRQFYAAVAVKDTDPATLGDIKVASTDDKKVFFKYLGKGGLLRSDLIDIDSVVYAKISKAADLRKALKKATITLASEALEDGKPIAGQDYIVKIYIHNYLAPGDSNIQAKYGSVHVTKGMTTAEFYAELKKSLEMAFSKEAAPLFKIEGGSTNVVITEVEQPWNLGTKPLEFVNFSVVPVTVLVEGEEVVWASTNAEGKIAIENSSTTVGNGKNIADLEYFCMGERGDQYRNQGWPNVIPTEYMVNPSNEYNVLDIHYSFSDTGVNVQKSEKDIIIVSTSEAVMTSLKEKLTALGIEVKEKAVATDEETTGE